MGYETGISKCKEALEILLSNELLDKRVDDAFSIIVELNPEDTPLVYYKEIVEWCEKYSLLKGLHIHLDGIPGKTDKKEELIRLSHRLADLCTSIISHSKNN